jgi:23S rRNA (pseudouridine1915-N3)-methyltransferase
MTINLIAVGKNMPSWIKTGFAEYAKRLSKDYKLQLIEIRKKEAMLSAIPKNSLIIALDERGRQWNTHELAAQLQKWRENYQQVSLLIGGHDGLAPNCLAKTHLKWSLSALTFPHQMVRIIVAEQLYRAWSILTKHPYHRGES